MLPSIQLIAQIQEKQTRFTQDGKQITNLRLSVGEKNSKGEYDNFYFEATFWEKSAEFVNNNFNDKDSIEIKGDLVSTSYAKSDGSKGYKTELKNARASFVPKVKSEIATQNRPPVEVVREPAGVPEFDVDDSELPF